MDKYLEKPEVKALLDAVLAKGFKIGRERPESDITEFNGIKGSGPFEPKFAKYAYEEWNPKKGDVIVCSYPKTGTHWVREIVTRLLYTDDQYKFMIHHDVLDQGPVERFHLFNKFDFPAVLCTHQPEFNVNIDRYGKLGAKIIYVYRNPKDVIVSYFHFQKNFPKGVVPDNRRDMDWEKTFSTFIDGTWAGAATRPGDNYLDHVLGYYNQRNKSNVLFLSYESMKQDTEVAIRKVSKFLGLEKSDEEIKAVLEKSSMKSMKKVQEGNAIMAKLNVMRKGVVGDWKNYFTVAQSEAIDDLVNEKMEGRDVEFVYTH